MEITFYSVIYMRYEIFIAVLVIVNIHKNFFSKLLKAQFKLKIFIWVVILK